MKRLRWFDFLSINLFWLGMNIRNTAVGSIFVPFLVAQYAPDDWKNTALSAISTAGLIMLSATISHGPLQALIPDMVPEDQRGRASAIKALFELVPIFLVGISIAAMVGAGHLGLAIVTTGAALLITALVTIFTVKEQPLKLKPDFSFWAPMLRVFYMLAGILLGVLAGLLC